MSTLDNLFGQYPNYLLQKSLLLYVSPFILVGGVIGNVLSVLVLSRPSMRRVSTYTYLTLLSIADTFVLLAGLHWLWLKELTGFSLREYSSWSCGTVVAINSTASDYSVWLIIAVTVERYIVVCHPLRAPTMCTRRRALVIAGALLVALASINAHFLWTMEIETVRYGGDNETSYPNCNYAARYMFLEDTWPSVDALLYSVIPLIVIVVFNALIVCKVIRAREFRSHLSEQTNHLSSSSATSSSWKGQGHQNFRLTIMLLAISVTFITLTLPMNSILIFNRFANLSDEIYYDDPTTVNMILADVIARLLMYVNHSSNFFLYCATGQKFRRQLCASCGCGRELKRRGVSVNNTPCEILRLSQRRVPVPKIAEDYSVGKVAGDVAECKQEEECLKRSTCMYDRNDSKPHRPQQFISKTNSIGIQVL